MQRVTFACCSVPNIMLHLLHDGKKTGADLYKDNDKSVAPRLWGSTLRKRVGGLSKVFAEGNLSSDEGLQ